MKVSPLEIRQKSFEKGFRGYEKEEVDAYLLTLSQEWERVLDELREAKLKIENQDRDLQKMREVETTLYKTLKTAEDTGSHLVEQARKQAELLLKEAQMNADAILNEAKYQAKNLIEESEAKSRTFEYETQVKVKEASNEVKEIENLKENLLLELRNICNETIEKTQRYQGKKSAAIKVEKVQANTSNPKVENPLEIIIEEKPAADNSFFDQL